MHKQFVVYFESQRFYIILNLRGLNRRPLDPEAYDIPLCHRAIHSEKNLLFNIFRLSEKFS